MYLVNLFFLKVIFILFFIFLLVEIVVTWSDCVIEDTSQATVEALYSETFIQSNFEGALNLKVELCFQAYFDFAMHIFVLVRRIILSFT